MLYRKSEAKARRWKFPLKKKAKVPEGDARELIVILRYVVREFLV
jgi:hypothetical protein